ncbi:MAG: hypothetical protein WC714_18650 [Candidatus Obscuribacterales bacterium]|jgi:uncharacterized membrane protein YvlD (DUF360 family)
MLLNLLIHVVLLVVALLWLVPKVTDGGVAVRQGSFFRGILALVAIALVNHIGWHLLALLGIATVVPSATMVVAGLVAGLVQAVAILIVGKIMPGVLFVRSFGTALGASLTMTVVGWLVMLLV